jgi:hypothetical protein
MGVLSDVTGVRIERMDEMAMIGVDFFIVVSCW